MNPFYFAFNQVAHLYRESFYMPCAVQTQAGLAPWWEMLWLKSKPLIFSRPWFKQECGRVSSGGWKWSVPSPQCDGSVVATVENDWLAPALTKDTMAHSPRPAGSSLYHGINLILAGSIAAEGRPLWTGWQFSGGNRELNKRPQYRVATPTSGGMTA